jgi:hypothetical protein
LAPPAACSLQPRVYQTCASAATRSLAHYKQPFSHPSSQQPPAHNSLTALSQHITLLADHYIANKPCLTRTSYETWRKTRSLARTLSVATVLTAMFAGSVMELHPHRKRHDNASHLRRDNVAVERTVSTHMTLPHLHRQAMASMTRNLKRKMVPQRTIYSCNGATTSNVPNKTSSERSRSEEGSLSSFSKHLTWLTLPRRDKKSSLRCQMKEDSSVSANC